jgi:hypothetical protein
MTEILSKKSFNRLICLVLAAVFLSSFPAGTTALALCLDKDENHIIDPNFYLADCHSPVDTDLLLSDEHCSALAEKENNDCVDVSLSNQNAFNRPSAITLPASAKIILSYALPDNQLRSQQQLAKHHSSALSQHLSTLPHINAQRTVILLT